MINNSHNINQVQPAFTANLAQEGLKLNQKKFRAVQKRFAELTHHYKEDTFVLKKNTIERDDNGTFFYNVDYVTNGRSNFATMYAKRFHDWFNRTSVEHIARNLKRIFDMDKFLEVRRVSEKNLRMSISHVRELQAHNERKAIISGKQIWETLAQNNNRRAQTLENQLKSYSEKANVIEKKVFSQPIDDRLELLRFDY